MSRRGKELLDIFIASFFTTWMFGNLACIILHHEVRQHLPLVIFYFALTIFGCFWIGRAFRKR